MPRRASDGRDGRHPRQAPAPSPAEVRALVETKREQAREGVRRLGPLPFMTFPGSSYMTSSGL